MLRKAHHLSAKVVVALYIWSPGLTFGFGVKGGVENVPDTQIENVPTFQWHSFAHYCINICKYGAYSYLCIYLCTGWGREGQIYPGTCPPGQGRTVHIERSPWRPTIRITITITMMITITIRRVHIEGAPEKATNNLHEFHTLWPCIPKKGFFLEENTGS